MDGIKETFGEIAGIYDRMNHALSLGLDRRWRRKAVSSAGVSSPVRILDLACGTGDMTLELARRFKGVPVEGVDITCQMLEIAKRKCSNEPFIAFTPGSASNLPFQCGEAGLFSLVTCAWGFRNFPCKLQALRESARVLQKEGKLVVLEFFRPGNALLGFLTDLWLRTASFLLAPRKRAAYAYLRNSIKIALDWKSFVAMAEDAGFELESRRFFFPACTLLVFRKR